MRASEFIKEAASAGATPSGCIATVASVPGAFRRIKKGKNGLPEAPQNKNKDGTAKSALDVVDNVMGSIVKRV